MMKPVCLGRKNYLFCGSEQAAKNTSLIYSIIESCKMNRLRSVKYIADVLRKLISDETDYMALLLIINQKYNSIWATIPSKVL